jgi:hypothetical protein
MEKRLNSKLEGYFTDFKDNVRRKIIDCDMQDDPKATALLEYIYDYNRLVLEKEDFVKRKRVKNSIPENNRCMAKRANGEQCTRRRKGELHFCGTHSKGTPHGVSNVEDTQEEQNVVLELIAQEIRGIVYYIDKSGNVYNTEDVLQSKENPQVIAKYVKDDGDHYSIPQLGLV